MSLESLTNEAGAGAELRQFVERIERLEEEKAAIADDVKEVYAELKGRGFDTKIVRKIVALRKMDANELAEQEAILDLYMQALGMLADTPLGRAAIQRDTKPAKTATPQVDLEEAIEGLGKPVEPTAAETERGVVAAFEKNGTRMTVAIPPLAPADDFPDIPPHLDRRPKKPAAAEA